MTALIGALAVSGAVAFAATDPAPAAAVPAVQSQHVPVARTAGAKRSKKHKKHHRKASSSSKPTTAK